DIGLHIQSMKCCFSQLTETLRMPGADIKKTAHIFILKQPENNFADIFYIYEITQLFTIFVVWVAGFEQLDFPRFLNLFIPMEDHTRHTSLEVLIWPIYIKKFKTDILTRKSLSLVFNPEIE